MRDWWPALALLLTSLIGALVLMARPPLADAPIAVVFPPWWSNDAALAASAASGAQIVGDGGIASIILVRAEDRHVQTRLSDAGALALIDASRMAGCSVRDNRGDF